MHHEKIRGNVWPLALWSTLLITLKGNKHFPLSTTGILSARFYKALKLVIVKNLSPVIRYRFQQKKEFKQ